MNELTTYEDALLSIKGQYYLWKRRTVTLVPSHIEPVSARVGLPSDCEKFS